MKNQIIILLCLALVTFSCKKEAASSDCISEMIESNGLTPYNGQELGCKFFVSEYEFEGETYYVEDNQCAFMLKNPKDCSGGLFCQPEDIEKINFFFSQAQFIKIIGYKE